jgi:GxxExxY protein
MTAIVKKEDLLYPELSYVLIGCAYEVYNELGPGHLEKFYQKAYAIALTKKGIKFTEQLYAPLFFQGQIIGKNFLDFFIEEKIIVELKKGNFFSKSNIDQVLEYMTRTKLKLALIINFASDRVIYKRIVNLRKENLELNQNH